MSVHYLIWIEFQWRTLHPRQHTLLVTRRVFDERSLDFIDWRHIFNDLRERVPSRRRCRCRSELEVYLYIYGRTPTVPEISARVREWFGHFISGSAARESRHVTRISVVMKVKHGHGLSHLHRFSCACGAWDQLWSCQICIEAIYTVLVGLVTSCIFWSGG